MTQFCQKHDILISDSDPCGYNAQILSGPEGSSNTGCLWQAWTPGHFFYLLFVICYLLFVICYLLLFDP